MDNTFSLPHRTWQAEGIVTSITSSFIKTSLTNIATGDLCTIYSLSEVYQAEVLTSSISGSTLSLFDQCRIQVGDRVTSQGQPISVTFEDECYKGAFINAFGKPLDRLRGAQSPLLNKIRKGGANQNTLTVYPRYHSKERKTILPVVEPLTTGVYLIDSLYTLGKGQKVGIFAEAGVGKSSLIETITKNCSSDHTIICLVGERRREVAEWIEKLSSSDDQSSFTLIASTSDESANTKSLSLDLACSLGESLREQGKDVVLVVDSLTRVARALRDIGLAKDEPLLTGGITPLVLETLPRIVERAGRTRRGTLTAFFTVLGSMESPFPDFLVQEIKSLLDGHIFLCSKRAQQQLFPAINISDSLSRLHWQLCRDKTLSHSLREIHNQILLLEQRINLGMGTHDDQKTLEHLLADLYSPQRGSTQVSKL